MELEIGDRVVYEGSGSPEYGYVIATWVDEETGAPDCYVAFVGDESLSKGERPKVLPYVLRYFQGSLRKG